MSKMIQINEVDVSDVDIQYICFGLGSCIALFMSDRTRGINGAAHIPLPENDAHNNELADATRLVDLLLKGFKIKGSDLLTLRAKIAGGSNIYNSVQSVGERNIRSVTRLLVDHRIYLAAADVGGSASRTARFDSQSGNVHITTSEKKTYFI